MYSSSRGRPAGNPSMMATIPLPWDSPAVRKRNTFHPLLEQTPLARHLAFSPLQFFHRLLILFMYHILIKIPELLKHLILLIFAEILHARVEKAFILFLDMRRIQPNQLFQTSLDVL